MAHEPVKTHFVCTGMLINRSAYAATGFSLDMQQQNLKGTVGLVVRVKGDGLTYAATLATGETPTLSKLLITSSRKSSQDGSLQGRLFPGA